MTATSGGLEGAREKATRLFTNNKQLEAMAIIKKFKPGWFTKDELKVIARAYEIKSGKAQFYAQLGFNAHTEWVSACNIIESKLEGFYK